MSASRWTDSDQRRALREGWAIFNEGARAEIQRDDETSRIVTDARALRVVRSKARAGSAFHRRALRVLAEEQAKP